MSMSAIFTLVSRSYGQANSKKGLYTLPQHKLQQQHTRDDIKNYVGVTLKAWYHDWRILNEISPKTLSTIRYTSILKMLDMGRGDYTLLEFPNDDDLIMHIDGIELHPLLGVKVIIPDSRRIAVSRQLPAAPKRPEGRSRGLRKSRQKD